MKWVQTFLGEIEGNGGSGILNMMKLNESCMAIYKQMKGLGKWVA